MLAVWFPFPFCFQAFVDLWFIDIACPSPFGACGLSLLSLVLGCSHVLSPSVLSIKCTSFSGLFSIIYVLVAERSCSSSWFALSLKEKSGLSHEGLVPGSPPVAQLGSMV